jgi:pimeloyl-ACP methyl ester carboxylesterase
MTTFALVHGAWHGGWCWERLVAELERHGHDAITVDLPCDDPDAGCTAYAEAVLTWTRGAGDDLVVVGHSLGGLTIPLVAAERPVRKLVFLCSLLPVPGLSLVDQLRLEPEIFVPGFDQGVARDELGRSYWRDADDAIDALYGDCPRQLASWAAARLRPQARAASVEPCSLASWPAVESASLFAADDAAISPAWSRAAARARLGISAIEPPGGHSPFLSRPGELAEALVAVAL